MSHSICLTCVQVGQVWVLNIRVVVFQVVAELHRRVGAESALGTIVHLYALVFPRVENVLADVLSTVGSDERRTGRGACHYITFGHLKSKKATKTHVHVSKKYVPE